MRGPPAVCAYERAYRSKSLSLPAGNGTTTVWSGDGCSIISLDTTTHVLLLQFVLVLASKLGVLLETCFADEGCYRVRLAGGWWLVLILF
jgi:hypothetical protein